ncbi:MAG: hypothetical protein ACRC1W_03525 [Shewanella sp.]
MLIHFTNGSPSITLTLLTKQGNFDEINIKFMGWCFMGCSYAYRKDSTKAQRCESNTNGFSGLFA